MVGACWIEQEGWGGRPCDRLTDAARAITAQALPAAYCCWDLKAERAGVNLSAAVRSELIWLPSTAHLSDTRGSSLSHQWPASAYVF